MFTQACYINLSVRLAREPKQCQVDYEVVWLFLLQLLRKPIAMDRV